MGLKFARVDAAVPFNGRKYHLNCDDPWPDNDPLVVARPDLFADEPRRVFTTGGAVDRPIETATRRPGERRPTRRG